MKSLRNWFKKFVFALLPVFVLCAWFWADSFEYTAFAAEDMCDNIDGVQETMPSGYSNVGSPGNCYVLPPPVTIDIVPPGGAPQTIDVNPANSNNGGVTIDVNPFNPNSNTSNVAPTTILTVDGITVSTTTPKVITSVAELQTYLFAPETTHEEKVMAIQTYIISLLQQIIEIIKAEKAGQAL